MAAAEVLGLKSPHREGIKALNPGGAGQCPRSLPTKEPEFPLIHSTHLSTVKLSLLPLECAKSWETRISSVFDFQTRSRHLVTYAHVPIWITSDLPTNRP